MLEYLYIDNIAIIESARINLDAGFTVLTGETGSGKSIIIDSIYAVLGEKTSKELIRSGCDTATVSACFSNLSKKTLNMLHDAGYTLEDKKLIVQRKLSLAGKNSLFICGQPTTVGFLKNLSKTLVNIHGQHDSQQLLNRDNHIDFLDHYINDSKTYEEYLSCFHNFRDISRKLSALETNEEEKAKRLELLKYQIEEIENAAITDGEIEKIRSYINKYKNSEKIINELNAVKDSFSNEGEGILSAIREDVKKTNKATELAPDLSEINNSLTDVENSINVFFDSLCNYLNNQNFNESDYLSLKDRLELLNSVVSKYGGNEQKTLAYLKSAKLELEQIENNDIIISDLENKLIIAEKDLIFAGEKLTALRTKAGKLLSDKIKNELEYLDFYNAQFSVEIKKCKYTSKGCDDVEFLISANVGEPLKPLQKVASGGELSRIMLAIRSILSNEDDVSTLIFDEIDSGISGNAAQKVATKLLALSRNYQVICVTHLAQIASKANNHLLISKGVHNGKTLTEVNLISGDDRIKEIARIISGDTLTENIYNTAKEMLGATNNDTI